VKRIALLSEDLDVDRRLFGALGPECYDDLVEPCGYLCHLEPPKIAKDVAGTGADIVVIGPDVDDMDALFVAETIDHDNPEITTILLAPREAGLIELALHAGVRHVLAPDCEPAELQVAIEKALLASDRRRENLLQSLPPPAEQPIAPDGRTRRVITVLSPKGGAGKTTISTNLAIGLARYAPENVAIVDLDLQFGDVASALGLTPEHTFADAKHAARRLDPAALKMVLTPHPKGAFALCAPDDPAAGEMIEIEDVAATLRMLSADLPYVVVDTGAGLDEAALTAIELSTDLVLVCATDVPSIRSLRKLLNALDALGMTGATRHVVFNRADSKVGIEADDVSAMLELPIAVSVPSSRSVPMSVNQGVPVVLLDPKSTVAQSMETLVGLFAEMAVRLPVKTKLWRLK
jgi:pilus assembly protein CpaE